MIASIENIRIKNQFVEGRLLWVWVRRQFNPKSASNQGEMRVLSFVGKPKRLIFRFVFLFTSVLTFE
jgi:hypothetical protein